VGKVWGTGNASECRGVVVVGNAGIGLRDGEEWSRFRGAVAKSRPPKAGYGRIVVFREKAYAGLIEQGWDIKLDGEPMNELKTGTFAYMDRPPGHHQLLSTEAMFPGVTKRDVTVAAGRTYFFLARMSERAQKLHTATAAGGLTGLLVMSAVTSSDDNPGPLDLLPLEDGAARTILADLKLSDGAPRVERLSAQGEPGSN
jgi:hypothetical protein